MADEEEEQGLGHPMTKDEQMQAVGDLLKDGDLLFAAVSCTNGDAEVVVNTLYEHPGAVGVVLADMVRHIVEAYVESGYDPTLTRTAILTILREELDLADPTPNSPQWMKSVLPEA